MDYLLAVDEGTTGTKALVVDRRLKPVAECTVDFKQHFPKPGWVEHDLNEIWRGVLRSIKTVTQKIDVKKIAALGITNQRETICFWEKSTGMRTRTVTRRPLDMGGSNHHEDTDWTAAYPKAKLRLFRTRFRTRRGHQAVEHWSHDP